jgi:hypothetical protein
VTPIVQYEKIRPKLPTAAEVEIANGTLAEVRETLHPAAYGPGNAIDFSAIGSPPQIDGAMVLDFIEQDILSRWMIFEEPWWAKVIADWIAGTWFADYAGTLVAPFYPILLTLAATGSGKSRLATIIRSLVRNPKGPVSGVVTAPGVRNALNAKHTLLLDEYHKTIQDGRFRIDLQSIILAYTPNAETLNGTGGEDTSHCIYGPKALFAQPSLEKSPFYTEDLFSRCFVIRLEPHPEADLPPLDQDFYDTAEFARMCLERWAAIECAPVAMTDHSEGKGKDMLWNIHAMPKVLKSRDWEMSVPLCMVADRAVDFRYPDGDPRRARWAKEIREACCAMRLGVQDGATLMGELKARREA